MTEYGKFIPPKYSQEKNSICFRPNVAKKEFQEYSPRLTWSYDSKPFVCCDVHDIHMCDRFPWNAQILKKFSVFFHMTNLPQLFLFTGFMANWIAIQGKLRLDTVFTYPKYMNKKDIGHVWVYSVSYLKKENNFKMFILVCSEYTAACLMLDHSTPVCSESTLDACWPRGLWLGRTSRHNELSRFHYYRWEVEFEAWINCNISILLGRAVHRKHYWLCF